MGATKFIKSFFKKYTEQDVPINLDLWPAINSRFQNSGEEVSNGSSGADHHGSQKSLMERVPEVIRKSTVLISPKKKENSMEKEKQGGGVRVTRRNFLKVSGATVAGTAMFGAIRKPVLRSLIESVPEEKAVSEEQISVGICRCQCYNFCKLDLHVRDNKIVKVTPAAYPDPEYGGGCLRSQAFIQRIYSPERIKYPMKRVGNRGEDKWERISWDEAINTIGTKFNEIRQKYGDQAIAYTTQGGNAGALSNAVFRLKSVTGGTMIDGAADWAWMWAFGKVLGPDITGVGSSGNETADYANAKTIIVWGLGLTETHTMQWRTILAAKRRGAKLIVIDPQFPASAAKADQWIPVRPASDGAIAMAMIKTVIDEGLIDRDFLTKRTVAPFLVRKDNGLFLRNSHVTGIAPEKVKDPNTGMETVNDPIVVWDAAVSDAKMLEEAQTPAMEGSYNVAGIQVTTAFDLLKEAAAEYTPEYSSKLSGVPAQTIHDLAVTYATNGPSAILSSPALDHYGSGHKFFVNIATLAAITGNLGKPGASVGDFYPSGGVLNNLEFLFPTMNFTEDLDLITLKDVAETGQLNGKPYPIKALYMHKANSVSKRTRFKDWMEHILPNLEFVVTADPYMVDSARYSDIILPVCDWFEYEEIVCSSVPYMSYNSKSINPLFESKPDIDIFRLLAQKMGAGKYFEQSNEDFINLLFNSPAAKDLGITFERLKQETSIRVLPKTPEFWIRSRFGTPSGRVEFYLEQPLPRKSYAMNDFDPEGERLPGFRPPTEIWDKQKLVSYPLAFIQEHARWRVHSHWFGVPMLAEIYKEPYVKINPIDAAARNIKNSDYVEIFNDRGHVVAKAVLTEGIVPGLTCMPIGWQQNEFKAGHYNEVTNGNLEPVTQTQSFYDTLVEIRKWEA